MTSNNQLPPIFLYDHELRETYPLVAGIDEAGRGPLAGPVVAAAVILPGGLAIDGVKDSKKVPEKSRKKIFWEITRHASAIGVGIVDSETIDRINILKSTKMAMTLAVKDLRVAPDILLIDAVKLDDLNLEQRSMFKGESVSASIAAASIIAKVVRDDIMSDYHKEYPAYNFKRHKGYSTREHMELIKVHGPCPVHRMSFNKVKDIQLPFG